jgi:hypothetical protein
MSSMLCSVLLRSTVQSPLHKSSCYWRTCGVPSSIDFIPVSSTASSPVGAVLGAVLRNVVIPLAIGTVQAAFGLPDLVGYALTFATVVIFNVRDVLQQRRTNPIAAGTLLNVVLSAVLLLVGMHSPLAHQAVFSAMLAVVTLASFFLGPRPLAELGLQREAAILTA